MFFTAIFLTLIITSCQKEVIAPTPIETSELTISDRSSGTEIEVTVESFSLQPSTVTVLLSAAEDLTDATPAEEQTVSFDSGSTTFSFQVNSYQTIGENLEITFGLGGIDLSQYQLDSGQFIIIEETSVD